MAAVLTTNTYCFSTIIKKKMMKKFIINEKTISKSNIVNQWLLLFKKKKRKKIKYFESSENVTKTSTCQKCFLRVRVCPGRSYVPVSWERLMLPAGRTEKDNGSATPFRRTWGICGEQGDYF